MTSRPSPRATMIGELSVYADLVAKPCHTAAPAAQAQREEVAERAATDRRVGLAVEVVLGERGQALEPLGHHLVELGQDLGAGARPPIVDADLVHGAHVVLDVRKSADGVLGPGPPEG